jgi:hypothetical protein
VAIVQTTAGAMSLYVDGAAEVLGQSSGMSSDRGFRIDGLMRGYLDAFTQGELDEVRVYREVLSSDQVVALFELNPTPDPNPNPDPNPDPNPNPAASNRWSFDGPSPGADHAGSNNASLLGGAMAFDGGDDGVAIAFDGSDDWLSLADQISFSDDEAFSISLWYQGQDTTQNGDWGTALLGRDSGDIYANLVLRDGFVEYVHYDNGWQHNIRSTTRVADGAWHHVAIVQTTASTMSLYVDGAAEVLGQSSGMSSERGFRIDGLMRGYLDAFTEGMLDEVRVYREAIDERTLGILARARYFPDSGS